METLDISILYDKTDEKKVDIFNKNTKSDTDIELHYDKVEASYEWVPLFEGTMRYLDNILRNPNRFLINEEEIVKIEQSKKVGMESIKHLSKHTNLIQDLNEDGEVIPSKLLNENKEETFNTYENRFIYTLILNMTTFVEKKKASTIMGFFLKDEKAVQYKGVTQVGKEKVFVDLNLKTKLEVDLKNSKKDSEAWALRISGIEHSISDLKATSLYKTLEKAKVQLVRPPVKKTNVILKNTNFQYAMKLWDYIQDHIDDNTKRDKRDKKYTDEKKMKKFYDETFLLNYLALCTLSRDEIKTKEDKQKITEQIIRKIIDINAEMSADQLKNMVGEQYAIVKYRNAATNEGIVKTFRKHIDKYLNKINDIKLN